MLRYTTSKALYRHASDSQGFDCGRACAQMIISALTQGVASGALPTLLEQAQPVPFTQDELRAKEVNKADVPGCWYTFPDEMLELLKKEPMLIALGLTDWRLANCADSDELFAWAAKSVRGGMPAVLNIRSEDHWVCLRSVTFDGDALTLMECLDPLSKHESNPPEPDEHTYLDLCETDKEWAVIKKAPGKRKGELGELEITIGDAWPTTYQGRCVGIVYGPPPEEIASTRDRAQRFQIKKPGPPIPEERVRALLMELAIYAEIDELAGILHGSSEISVRTVRDITGVEQPYAIAAMFTPAIERGVVAIFDEGVNTFIRLRLTSSKRLTDSIALSSSVGTLWWQRRGVPTLYSPYFPFAQTFDQGQIKYRRLIDAEVLVSPSGR